uniref:Reverse transcriptase domain-containing protein n=1 Tax=Amicula sp. isolate GU52X-4 cfCalB7 TaxID=3003489 RepID=A0A9E9C3K1_9STRA|nr:hypothetical protein [Amicula sp. isolate GU52X-4 cfCalB7]
MLSNIYLNELDKFVENLMLEFFKGKRCKANQKYRSVADLRSSKNKTVSEKNRILKIVRKQKITASDLKDPNFRRVKYARYADDFVRGISGEKKFAKQIMSTVKVFFKTQFHLNVSKEKSSLLSIVHRQAFFFRLLIKASVEIFKSSNCSKFKR